MPSARLVKFIQDANIGLIRCTWIRKQAKDGGVFLRRQDMPPEAFMPAEDLKEDTWMLVVSHIWESVEHPDPTGQQLRRIAEMDEMWVRYEVAFYDFSSLAQYVRHTEQEKTEFAAAMKSMHLLYADDGVFTLRIQDTPEWPQEVLTKTVRIWSDPDGGVVDRAVSELTANKHTGAKGRNSTEYVDRGWCAAECSWIATGGALLKWLNAGKRHSGVLLTPEAFEEKTKSGKLTFTFNGDMGAVTALQREVFEHAAQNVTCFRIRGLTEQELATTLTALQRFRRLEGISIEGSELDEAVAALLGEAARWSGCETIELEAGRWGDEAEKAYLRRWPLTEGHAEALHKGLEGATGEVTIKVFREYGEGGKTFCRKLCTLHGQEPDVAEDPVYYYISLFSKEKWNVTVTDDCVIEKSPDNDGDPSWNPPEKLPIGVYTMFRIKRGNNMVKGVISGVGHVRVSESEVAKWQIISTIEAQEKAEHEAEQKSEREAQEKAEREARKAEHEAQEKAMREAKEKAEPEARPGWDVAAIFAKYDESGDGVITRDKLRNVLLGLANTAADTGVDEAQIDRILEIADVHGDGVLNVEAFAEWVSTPGDGIEALQRMKSMSRPKSAGPGPSRR